MKLNKKMIALFAFAVQSVAMAQVNNKINPNPVTDFIKNGQIPKPVVGPYIKITGQWISSSGTVTSEPQEEKYKEYRYEWSGRIIGAINDEGKYRFRSDNGCEITGSALPFASDNMWSTESEMRGCPFRHMNQRLIGRIVIEGKTMTFRAEDNPFAMGRHISYEFKGYFGKI